MSTLALVALLFGQAPQAEEPVRLRTLLQNGAAVLVERVPGAKHLSVQLFVANRQRDTSSNYGQRHLLEHLVAKGQDKRLDRRLELVGMFLTAHTHRDSSSFAVTCAPSQLDAALAAVREIASPPKIAATDLENEHRVMRQELAILGHPERLGVHAWKGAYHETGLDPIGTLEAMRAATPDSLMALHKTIFSPSNLVVVVAGDVPVRETSAKVARVFADNSKPVKSAPEKPRVGTPGRFETEEAFGEARAALVPNYKSQETVATLAAALAIASRLGDSFVTYTPSTQDGLVILGRQGELSGLGTAIDALSSEDIQALFPLGVRLAEGWVRRQLRDPAFIAALRGSLLAQGHGERPEAMLDALKKVTLEEFKGGVGRFSKEKAVIVVGVGR